MRASAQVNAVLSSGISAAGVTSGVVDLATIGGAFDIAELGRGVTSISFKSMVKISISSSFHAEGLMGAEACKVGVVGMESSAPTTSKSAASASALFRYSAMLWLVYYVQSQISRWSVTLP